MTDNKLNFKLKGPGNFDGTKANWETWAFELQTYARTVDFRLGLAFKELEQLAKGELPNDTWIEDFDLNNQSTQQNSSDFE